MHKALQGVQERKACDLGPRLRCRLVLRDVSVRVGVGPRPTRHAHRHHGRHPAAPHVRHLRQATVRYQETGGLPNRSALLFPSAQTALLSVMELQGMQNASSLLVSLSCCSCSLLSSSFLDPSRSKPGSTCTIDRDNCFWCSVVKDRLLKEHSDNFFLRVRCSLRLGVHQPWRRQG